MRRSYCIAILCAASAALLLVAGGPHAASPAAARTTEVRAHVFGTDLRLGLDQILPDNFRTINGIARFPWATNAARYGARINRVSFDWQTIEPRAGAFNFSMPEAYVQSDQAHGMQTIAILEHTPYWATNVVTQNPSPQVPSGLSLPWNDPANTWGAYVSAVAAHFKGQVAYFEVWNEPDLYNGASWAGTRADFFQLLKVAYLAIKAEDPSALVITGSLNYNPTWLTDVLVADVKDPQAAANNYYFDAIGLHSYGRANAIASLSGAAQHVLSLFHIGGKQILATELGIPVSDDPGAPNRGLIGTSDESASYVIEAAASALAGGVDHILFYRASDVGQEGYWGFWKTNGVTRKMADAFKVISRLFTNVHSAVKSDSDPVTSVVLDEGSQRVTVLWNNSPRQLNLPVLQQAAGGAQLLNSYGFGTHIESDSSGYYHLTLPPATNNHGVTSSDFIIGGGPLMLVENGPFLPTSTPSPTDTPTASPSPTTVMSTPTDSATVTPSPSPTPIWTVTDTPTNTWTPTPAPTPTATFSAAGMQIPFAEGSTAPAYTEVLDIAALGSGPTRLHLTLGGDSGPISTTDTLVTPPALTTFNLSTMRLPLGPMTANLQANGPIVGRRTIFYGSSAMSTIGSSAPATTWYLPGIAGVTPETQIVAVTNPNNDAAGLSVQTIDSAGSIHLFTAHVDAHGRRAFVVARQGQNADVATIISADRPVVADYSAYLRSPAALLGTTGVSTLSRLWYNAEGYANQRYGDYLVVFNPDLETTARITISLYLPNPKRKNGVPLPVAVRTVSVAPASRAAVDLGAMAPAGGFSMIMTSTLPVAANRTATFGPGKSRAAVTTGTIRPVTGWLFPDGYPGALNGARGVSAATGFSEYLLVFNPSANTAAQVTIQVSDGTGRPIATLKHALLARSRISVDIGSLGVTTARPHIVTVQSTNRVPIVAEQSVFFNQSMGGFTGAGAPIN